MCLTVTQNAIKEQYHNEFNEHIEYLIIANSGRALVNSAKKAGYKVGIIDAFLDEETVLLSSLSFKATYTHQLGFDIVELEKLIKQLSHSVF